MLPTEVYDAFLFIQTKNYFLQCVAEFLFVSKEVTILCAIKITYKMELDISQKSKMLSRKQ